ncbi:hypothetical protein R4575_18150 [Acinetobacter baumannii]|nr:hypothetical protein [Acinetobacter baumannii]
MEKIHFSWLGQCYEILLSVFLWKSYLVPIAVGVMLGLAIIGAYCETKPKKKEIFEAAIALLASYIGVLIFIVFVIIAPYSLYYFLNNSKVDAGTAEDFKEEVSEVLSNNNILKSDKIILRNAIKEMLKDGEITYNEIRIYKDYQSKLLNKRKEEKIYKELNSGNLETPNEE